MIPVIQELLLDIYRDFLFLCNDGSPKMFDIFVFGCSWMFGCNFASFLAFYDRLIDSHIMNTPLYGLSSVPLITMIEHKKFQKFRASL